MDRRQLRGRWAELVAAAWLIENGYEVFLGYGQTTCDIVALKAGVVTRVEVKAASPSSGPKAWLVAKVKPELHDMLLVVLPDGEILIDPPSSQIYIAR